MRKKVTLSLEHTVYDAFQKYCKENDIQLSKRVERLLRKELDEKRYKI